MSSQVAIHDDFDLDPYTRERVNDTLRKAYRDGRQVRVQVPGRDDPDPASVVIVEALDALDYGYVQAAAEGIRDVANAFAQLDADGLAGDLWCAANVVESL